MIKYVVTTLALLLNTYSLNAKINSSLSYEQGFRSTHFTAQVNMHKPIFINSTELHIDRVKLHASHLTTFYQRLTANTSYNRLSLDLFYEKGTLDGGRLDAGAKATLYSGDDIYKANLKIQNLPIGKKGGHSWETGIKLSYLIYQQERWSLYSFLGATYHNYTISLSFLNEYQDIIDTLSVDTAFINKRFLKFARNKEVQIPWITPTVGLKSIYDISSKWQGSLQVQMRRATLPKAWFNGQKFQSFGYGMGTALEYRLKQHWKLGVHLELEKTRLQLALPALDLSVTRFSKTAAFRLEYSF